jgi:hypothetical protein
MEYAGTICSQFLSRFDVAARKAEYAHSCRLGGSNAR